MGNQRLTKGKMQVISRESFPIGKAITVEHVKLVNGLACQNWSSEELSDAVKSLQAVKRNAQSWGKAQIEAIILNAAKDLGIPALTMGSLKELYKKDPSPHFAAQMFACTRGWFDEHPRWEYDLETQHMHQVQMIYCESEGDRDTKVKKGCFLSITSRASSSVY